MKNGILRVGIIGAGWIAEKAAITLAGLTDCEAYAIGSRSMEKAEAFARPRLMAPMPSSLPTQMSI